MKPLIMFRSKDGALIARFSTEPKVNRDVVGLKKAGWEVLGVIRLKMSVSVQNVDSMLQIQSSKEQKENP